MKVNILGTEYEIIIKSFKEEDPKLEMYNGYCEPHTKKLVVGIVKDDPSNVADLQKHYEKVLRHEIIHAFLIESGLDACSDWARNEEIIDWIAMQGPKIMTAWEAAKEAL